MRFGRFSFGSIIGGKFWGYERPQCDCHIFSFGWVYIVWSGKNCKCGLCGQYDCECKCPLCDRNYLKCDCEKFE